MSAIRHVVFGAGAIGATLAEVLLARGESGIRLVSRSGRAAPDDRVEVLAGDVEDAAFAIDAARGARFVYQVLNPRYNEWGRRLPPMQDAVLRAAESAGARLVSMENVYLYGRPAGRPFLETDPARAATRMGLVRGRMSQQLLGAHRAGRVEVAIGRASDYYGPRGGAQSQLGDRMLDALLTRRTVRVLGDATQPHTYSFIPDIAAGLPTLALEPAAAGDVWHLPNDPAPASTADLVALAARSAGVPAPAVRSIPKPLLAVAGIVDPVIRELREMRYEFEAPFLVDSSRIRDAFGLAATPHAEGLDRTVRAHQPRSR